MPVTVVQGEQRGDEGKGRFVDMLAQEHEIVARYAGGQNAGHTVVTPEGTVLRLHLVPSGITSEHTVNVIGTGTVIEPRILSNEFDDIESKGFRITPERLLVSSAAHLVLPHHISEDELRESSSSAQGSTKSGIAPAYSAKYMREGWQVASISNHESDLLHAVYDGIKKQKDAREAAGLESLDAAAITDEYTEGIRRLAEFVTDTALYLNDRLNTDDPARILAEGAQAYLLDVDHGMYPYTTSSSTGANGVASGLGIPARHISRTIGVSKMVQSHVGGGPFVTEIIDPDMRARLHGDMTTVDAERGATTGRTRRLGHLDLPGIRRAQMVTGTTEMAITKLDWVPRFGEEVPICVAYKQKNEQFSVAPDTLYELAQSEPVYRRLPTWRENIQGVREFDDLPENAQNYVTTIEAEVGVPITMIGVGPARDQVILR